MAGYRDGDHAQEGAHHRLQRSRQLFGVGHLALGQAAHGLHRGLAGRPVARQEIGGQVDGQADQAELDDGEQRPAVLRPAPAVFQPQRTGRKRLARHGTDRQAGAGRRQLAQRHQVAHQHHRHQQLGHHGADQPEDGQHVGDDHHQQHQQQQVAGRHAQQAEAVAQPLPAMQGGNAIDLDTALGTAVHVR